METQSRCRAEDPASDAWPQRALGWGTLDYGVVNARVTTALLALRMEKQAPVPADRKADVELVRKWKDKIDQAKKM